MKNTNDNWYFKNEKDEVVPASSKNLKSFFDSLDEPQVPRSEAENREIEDRYMQQLNRKVRCYYDGTHNITEFL